MGIVIQVRIFQGPALAAFFILLFAGVVVNLAAVGGFVAVRVPSNPIGWMMSAAGLAAALSFYGGAYAQFAHDVIGSAMPFDVLGAWFGSWLFGPTLGGLVLFLLFLFPTGRFLSHRWRWAGRLAILGLALSFAGMAFAPGPLNRAPWIVNPFGFTGGGSWLELAEPVGNALAIPVFVMALASFIVRVRRAGQTEREQLKWFGFPAMGWLALLLLSIATTGPLSDALWAAGLLVLAVLPVAIGVAILRFRLWDIDRIVSRTIAYGILTVLLAGLFGLSVVVLEEALTSVTAGDTIVVAISTLAVASIFQPLRRRIQRAVDSRFDRASVDRAALVARFGVRLRDQHDLGALLTELTATVDAGTAPKKAEIWIARRWLRRIAPDRTAYTHRTAEPGASAGGGGRTHVLRGRRTVRRRAESRDPVVVARPAGALEPDVRYVPLAIPRISGCAVDDADVRPRLSRRDRRLRLHLAGDRDRIRPVHVVRWRVHEPLEGHGVPGVT